MVVVVLVGVALVVVGFGVVVVVVVVGGAVVVVVVVVGGAVVVVVVGGAVVGGAVVGVGVLVPGTANAVAVPNGSSAVTSGAAKPRAAIRLRKLRRSCVPNCESLVGSSENSLFPLASTPRP